MFQFSIPNILGDPILCSLSAGDILYILGANGSGKSSLVSRLFNEHPQNSKRISAHRQTWFESNALNITPHHRQELENSVRYQETQPHSRYRDWNPAGRANMAIYDLIDADTTQERQIARLVRDGDLSSATAMAASPSPIQVINELMKLSNLPISVSVDGGQNIFAQRDGGQKYSVAELSDGERNAFLIAAEVLTAKPGTLVLIDEPERHLHRSINSPLLRLLFDRRSDCAFIVSTHEPHLPLDTPNASTLLVRSCKYVGKNPDAWSADLLEPGTSIDDDLKSDILGSRQRILFVEGTVQSLDAPLYSLLFPQVSIVPKDGCREVEYAVRGLRGTSAVHWISCFGIVDNDQRSVDDVTRLKQAGIWALPHYSVESFYFHPKIMERIAKLQVRIVGGDASELTQNATDSAIAGAKTQRNHLVESALVRSARSKLLQELPSLQSIKANKSFEVKVDIPSLRAVEERRFDKLISESDWDGLLARYPLRESSAFHRIASGLRFKDVATYRAAVLKLLQDDSTAVDDLRGLLGDLYASIMA